MITLLDVLDKVQEYKAKYRREGLPCLERSKIYVLFPDSKKDNDIELKWPDTWPNSERHGIYLIMGEHFRILYIGKASMEKLGCRLGSYFKYGEDNKSCKVVGEWSQQPKYVLTIAVPNDIENKYDMPFEAAALEEFLLKEFKGKLPDNTIGM